MTTKQADRAREGGDTVIDPNWRRPEAAFLRWVRYRHVDYYGDPAPTNRGAQ